LFSDLVGDKKISSFAPALKRALKTYNNSTNTSTGFISAMLNSHTLAANLKKAVQEKLQQNAQGTQPNARYQKPLMPGDRIRIAVEELDNSIRQKIKNHVYKFSHHAVFSEKVFITVRQDKNTFVHVEGTKNLYPRGSCLYVPPGTSEDS
jgi:hypothetical protein